MKLALMFSGQGAQYHGMGSDLYKHYDSVKNVYIKSEDITTYPIRNISFNDGDHRLNETKYTQICMFTLYQAILVLLDEKNIHVDYSMGLSLGEYGAYLHQGIFDFKTGLNLIKMRASLMEEASSLQAGAMCAVIGMREKALMSLISELEGYATISNYNAHEQLVISGEKTAINQLVKKLKAAGLRRVIPLNTSGAFHSKLMETAGLSFEQYLKDIKLNEPKFHLYLNTTGRPYISSIKKHMKDQLTEAVRFYQMVESMIQHGVDTFIEVGPKKTLSQLVRRISHNVKVLNIEDSVSLHETMRYLEENQDEL